MQTFTGGAKCHKCKKVLKGNWSMESNPNNCNSELTGKYLGVDDAFFFYSESEYYQIEYYPT